MAPSAPDITVADLSPSAHGRPATGSSATSPSADATISIDLYRAGAFASQKTTYYCVPASIEIMLNFMSDSPPDTTRARQDALYAKTRDDLIQPYWGKGAQLEGWATVLSDEDAGTYELGIRTNATQALHVAAKQLWATGRPVGLLVWRGFHAWVMSGFTSIGDPATTDSFRVTGVFVEDPWYPRISRTYGRGQAPDTYLSTTKLARFFLPYDQHGEGGLDKDGRYVVVVPVSVP